MDCYYYARKIKDLNNEIKIQSTDVINELGIDPNDSIINATRANISTNRLPSSVIQFLQDNGYTDQEINSTKNLSQLLPNYVIKNFNQSISDLIDISQENSQTLIDQATQSLDNYTPPYANFTAYLTSGYSPITVQFIDSPLRYPSYWYWDFGEGINSTLQNVTHNYANPGNYTVNLTVSNTTTENSSIIKSNYINTN